MTQVTKSPVELGEVALDFTVPAVQDERTISLSDYRGKTPLLLTWSENVVRHTNRNVLILAPLAVSHQIIREGEKFGVEIRRSCDGKPAGKIPAAARSQASRPQQRRTHYHSPPGRGS